MNIDSFIQTLGDHLDAAGDSGARVKVLAEDIATFFSARSHEVGIFTVNRKQHSITFVWPQGVANVSHVPLNAVNSLVAKTANELTATLDNSFASSRHLFIFEFMLAEKGDRIPVQKIMSVPVVANGEAVAVIQLSRKGPTPGEAGTDFSKGNLADLERIAALLSTRGL